MARYMGIHSFPKNAFTEDQVYQLANAAQNDPNVRGYRSFMSLADGKAVCILEAQSKQAVADWFRKMNLPTDSISEIELEGDRGQIEHMKRQTVGA